MTSQHGVWPRVHGHWAQGDCAYKVRAGPRCTPVNLLQHCLGGAIALGLPGFHPTVHRHCPASRGPASGQGQQPRPPRTSLAPWQEPLPPPCSCPPSCRCALLRVPAQGLCLEPACLRHMPLCSPARPWGSLAGQVQAASCPLWEATGQMVLWLCRRPQQAAGRPLRPARCRAAS